MRPDLRNDLLDEFRIVSELLDAALLVALLFGAIALDLGRLGKLEYQDVMSTRPEAWEPGAHSSRFSSRLVQDGYRSLWVRQSKCLDLLGWGVPSPYYDFTINDRPATPAACRRGLNVLEWSVRTPPAG